MLEEVTDSQSKYFNDVITVDIVQWHDSFVKVCFMQNKYLLLDYINQYFLNMLNGLNKDIYAGVFQNRKASEYYDYLYVNKKTCRILTAHPTSTMT